MILSFRDGLEMLELVAHERRAAANLVAAPSLVRRFQ